MPLGISDRNSINIKNFAGVPKVARLGPNLTPNLWQKETNIEKPHLRNRGNMKPTEFCFRKRNW